MLSMQQAVDKLLVERTEVASVEAGVVYRDRYLFRVIFRSSDEADYDPFFSVQREGGEVKEFAFLHDGDPQEVTALFLAAERD